MKYIFRLIQAYSTLALITTSHAALADNHTEGGAPEGGGSVSDVMITNPLGNTSLLQLIDIVIDGVITLLVPIIILMVIYSGFLFVTAQGNTDKLSKAKMTLGYTLLGALLILGAHALSTLIENTVRSLNV